MSETAAKSPAPTPATAYSYIRLSSKRQANSEEKKAYRDGFRRQVEMREEYLAANPHLTLDTTLSLHDIGVSGYTQANSAPGGHGKLAAFQRAVDEGRVARGSYLLVESLDRMTRAQVNVAQHMLLGLVNAGIIVVSLTDKMVYRAAPDDPAQQANFMYSVMTLMRAHEESRMKSKRLRATWDKKREDITQRKLTAKCPSWLTLKDGEFVPVEERVEIVRDVLGMLADGFGRDRIAAVLNARGVKPWGIGNQWHGGTVQKLTESRAIIGEFQPCKLVFEERKGILVSKRVPVGAPVPNYFPTVVSQDLWDRARAVAVKRRMGKAPNAGGRQGTVVSNLFGMIAKCSTCGRTMNYRERGSRSTPVLRCSGERSGNCSNSYRFPYREMEDAALSWMLKLDLSAGAPGELQKLEDTLRTKLARRDALQAEGEAIVGEIGRGSRFAQAPLARIEAAMEVVEVEIANLTAGITALRDAGGQDERRAAIHLVMDLNRRQAPDDERFAVRSRLRQMLRDTITSMMCEPDGHIRITTIDGQEHLFRDGFWFQDGEWLPWAGGFFGLHPKITKAEKARRAQWLQEAREALWKARQGEGGADSPKADMAS